MGQPTDPKYRFWRKVWVASLVAAIVAIILSWVLRANFANGLVASYVFLGLSYAFIFVALFVDFRKVRPFRRAQEREAAKPLSKNQQRKLEKEEQLAAAARKAEEERVKAERQEKRTAFKSKIGIGRSGKSDSGDEASPDGEGASDRE
jgi:Zn-dependent protease with chaperone function